MIYEFNTDRLFSVGMAARQVIQSIQKFSRGTATEQTHLKNKTYFNLLKTCDDCETMEKIVRRLGKEDKFYIIEFLRLFVTHFNEEELMEQVFTDKDTMSDEDYMNLCEQAKNVREFKNLFCRGEPNSVKVA